MDKTQTPFRFLWLLMPLSLLAAALAWVFLANPLQSLGSDAPPVENMTFERTVLDDHGVRLKIRAGGSAPMQIAQVQIDAAYWQFTQEPQGQIARGGTVWLDIPFKWMLGESHVVTVVTASGTTFEHEIAVAIPSPQVTAAQLNTQAMIGIFVGVLPIVFGLMFYPVLQGAGRETMNFLLALTVGLLVFLLIDTIDEAFEFAGEAASIFQGTVMVVLVGMASFFVLMAVGNRGGKPSGLSLATFIALGIGLHNFGEGLAIGAAFAAGSAGLGTYLILGFTLHNITEGIGIAAPILKKRPPLLVFAGLALLAGGPAVIGMWLGSLAFSAHWAAFAMAVGAGAILQVVVQVSAYLMRSNDAGRAVFYSRPVILGMAVGVGFMYATAALVKI
jgi:zinc transporter ZupT